MSESNIDNNDAVQPAEIPGYVSIKTILEALYPAVLRREIAEHELASRLENIKGLDKSQLTQLIRSFILSAEFIQKFEQLTREQPLLGRHGLQHTSAKLRSVAAVAVYNEAWLPFCLAIADYLYEEYSLQTLLVTYSPFTRSYDAELISPAVVQSISLKDVMNLSGGFEPDLLVVHSFGYKDETSQLLAKFKFTPLFVYGDAYKNTLSDCFDEQRPVAQSLMFGFNDGSADRNKLSTVKSKLIGSDAVVHYRSLLADYYPFNKADVNAEPARYAVFYLRYWGVGAYNALSDEEIIYCWLETVRKNLPKEVTLIIKNDPRVKVGMYDKFRDELRNSEIISMDFSEYLYRIGLSDETMGMAPVEYFYTKGFLCNAVAHFVLDSSLAYSLAVDKNIRRPVKVFIGPESASFSKFRCETAINNIIYGVELYSRGLMQSSEVGHVREIGPPSIWPRCFELS